MNNPDNPVAECPPPELLQQVARGAIYSARDERTVEDHLNQCDACRKRFDQFLASPEEMAELRTAATAKSESELEAIRAAGGKSTFPSTEVLSQRVFLPCGLKLDIPREPRFLGRLREFDIVSVLGAGGMGVVLKAYDDSLRREVAVKVIGLRWANNAVARARFVSEAQCAARLAHPNIITVHAVSREEPPLIVMEYVRGKSLALEIAECGRLEAARAAKIVRQVLDALAHAHAQGIVHRDVKPENILLEEGSQRVKLVDFGLARGVADAVRHTAEGTIVGTPWYMSPEQASGTPQPDARSDLFAAGVVLFEMLTGVLPFPGRDAQQVLHRIRTEAAPDPCQVNPAVCPRLGEIVVRAMQKDLARRFQSAQEFADAVDQYLAGMVTPTPAPGRSTPILPASSGQQGNYCGACSGIMVSKLSAAGRCEVCGAPICQKCWHVHRLRHCSQHVPEVPAAGQKAGESVAVAQRPLPSAEKQPSPDHAPAPAEPIGSGESGKKPAEALSPELSSVNNLAAVPGESASAASVNASIVSPMDGTPAQAQVHQTPVPVQPVVVAAGPAQPAAPEIGELLPAAEIPPPRSVEAVEPAVMPVESVKPVPSVVAPIEPSPQQPVGASKLPESPVQQLSPYYVPCRPHQYRSGDQPVPQYRLRAFLGRGAIGEVWKATGPGGTEVALKVVNLGAGGYHGGKELRAVQLVKRIHHPNLAPIHGIWLKDEAGDLLDDDVVAQAGRIGTGGPSDAMRATMLPAQGPADEHVPVELIIVLGLGEKSLADRLRECCEGGLPGIPPDELFSYMDDAAGAIDFLNSPLHELGEGPVPIRHCDIKPLNILVVGGRAQVCDFGLARIADAIRASCGAMGTPAYAAPELLNEGKPSATTDLYCLAVSYHELRTGRLPYEDESFSAVINAALNGRLDLGRLPPAEREVIRRATAPDPLRRYATATEMVKELRRKCAAGPDSPRRGFLRRFWSPRSES